MEVVQLLLSRRANVDCKSSEYGTPLLTALEACAAPTLRRLKSEAAKELVTALYLPGAWPTFSYIIAAGDKLLDCEEIVRLLVKHGADVNDDSRPFGPPLHLACLLGSKAMVELLLAKGADLNATTSFFKKAIFAAIHGGHLDIVALLLKSTANQAN